MLTDYINAAMQHARIKRLADGSIFATIPPFEGLWANAETEEAARAELQESLEDWILLGFRHRDPLPIVDGIDLNDARSVA